MATPFSDIYAVFLSQVRDDSFIAADTDEEAIIEQDLQDLLIIALDNFKFPRISLDNADGSFTATLDRAEINVLAKYMKAEWASRLATDFRLVVPQYQTKDFKQAANPDSHLKTLIEYAKQCKIDADRAANLYHRTYNHTPYDYASLAGSENV